MLVPFQEYEARIMELLGPEHEHHLERINAVKLRWEKDPDPVETFPMRVLSEPQSDREPFLVAAYTGNGMQKKNVFFRMVRRDGNGTNAVLKHVDDVETKSVIEKSPIWPFNEFGTTDITSGHVAMHHLVLYYLTKHGYLAVNSRKNMNVSAKALTNAIKSLKSAPARASAPGGNVGVKQQGIQSSAARRVSSRTSNRAGSGPRLMPVAKMVSTSTRTSAKSANVVSNTSGTALANAPSREPSSPAAINAVRTLSKWGAATVADEASVQIPAKQNDQVDTTLSLSNSSISSTPAATAKDEVSTSPKRNRALQTPNGRRVPTTSNLTTHVGTPPTESLRRPKHNASDAGFSELNEGRKRIADIREEKRRQIEEKRRQIEQEQKVLEQTDKIEQELNNAEKELSAAKKLQSEFAEELNQAQAAIDENTKAEAEADKRWNEINAEIKALEKQRSDETRKAHIHKAAKERAGLERAEIEEKKRPVDVRVENCNSKGESVGDRGF